MVPLPHRRCWLLACALFASACTHDWDAYEVTESPGTESTCAGVEQCDFSCSEANCGVTCSESATCSASCSGGNCTMRCGDAATCDFTCSGGGCTFDCGIATTCTTTCSGGGCNEL